MMAILISIILAALALAFVLYPLLHRGSTDDDDDGRGGEGALLKGVPTAGVPTISGAASELAVSSDGEREQAARVALREVELDFQLGNIEELDYRTLRERYMRRALVALKSRYDREQELDDMIEEQLRKLKEREQDATQ